MQNDIWGAAVTTTSRVAVAVLDAATLSLLSQRDDAARRLAAAVAADPSLVMGHAALGILHLASGRGPRQGDARRCLAAARTCGSAWNKDPAEGVIGVRTGPLW
ncbi:MAG TPA: hypothetical protein VGN83_00055 [Falsiroseomonas sp.]|nr:hypothetical protein [Falsiroseomonas sp.]